MKNRMTKKIGLALISSSLIFQGCARHIPEQNEQEQIVVQPTSPPSGGTTWWYFHSSGSSPSFSPGTNTTMVSGIRSGGFVSSPSVSSRGGFGAAGHAFSGAGA